MEIAWGLLVGVGAGVTSSVILGGYHWIREQRKRQDQVKYIRDCIMESFFQISSDIVEREYPGRPPLTEPGQLRPELFGELLGNLEEAVLYRATALDYSQVFDLKKSILDARNLAENSKVMRERHWGENKSYGRPQLTTSITFYRNVYGVFSKIEWLRLPREMPEKP
ncbi:MAG: hypothetical protein OXK82_05605 [Deltaproteobacteria bacterium]|nr:hypothetical protein [Deltaproteobacteria bacterium]